MNSDFQRPPASSNARRPLLVAIVLFAAYGCSPTRIAVGTMVPVIDNSRAAALASNDIKTFQAAAPANLFLIEGLIRTDPGKYELRVAAAMLYFSYAFAFIEEYDEAYASLLYLKGFEHGKTVLFRNREFRNVWNASFNAFETALQKMTEKDLPALVWTAANWSQFISLHLDSTAVLSDIPRVTAIIERACDIDGSYFEGLSYIMRGSVYAFRPPVMGGDPEASRESFERAMSVSDGKFLLAHYLYAKFYCYRIQDADAFETVLKDVIAQPDSLMPEYRLLNSIAKQKAAHLLKEKDDLF